MVVLQNHAGRCCNSPRGEEGFTIIEIVVVIVITGLLAGVFSQLLITSIDIYTEHNLRKTAHIDFRRAFDMTLHDVREYDLNEWSSTSASQVLFNKYNRFRRWGSIYYSHIRIGYVFSGDGYNYRRDETNWNTQYPIIRDGISSSSFNTAVSGGVPRITIAMIAYVNGKPMRMRSTVYPRMSGQ